MLKDIITALILFIITCVLVLAPGATTTTEYAVGTPTPSAPKGILKKGASVKKNLKVEFADTKNERIFSKKTGKIKADKVRNM